MLNGIDSPGRGSPPPTSIQRPQENRQREEVFIGALKRGEEDRSATSTLWEREDSVMVTEGVLAIHLSHVRSTHNIPAKPALPTTYWSPPLFARFYVLSVVRTVYCTKWAFLVALSQSALYNNCPVAPIYIALLITRHSSWHGRSLFCLSVEILTLISRRDPEQLLSALLFLVPKHAMAERDVSSLRLNVSINKVRFLVPRKKSHDCPMARSNVPSD